MSETQHNYGFKIFQIPSVNYQSELSLLRVTVVDNFNYSFQNGLSLSINEDEVHLWKIYYDLEELNFNKFKYILSEDERLKAEHYHFKKDQKRYVVTHGLLRKIIGVYLGVESSQLTFSNGSHGKPMLKEKAGESSLCFNISYSHGFAILAFTRNRKIGVDIEKIKSVPDYEEIVQRFFSCREKFEFNTIPSSKKLEVFYNCWTRKEAFLKATGEGLSRSLNSFDVSFLPGEPAYLCRIKENPQESTQWSLWAFTPTFGFSGALAVEGFCVFSMGNNQI